MTAGNTKVPFVEMKDWAVVTAPPPDGNYAVITYDPGPVGPLRLANALPWMARIYAFKGGLCDDIACGSDLSEMISRYSAAKAYLVGISAERRLELEQMLAKKGIELVPDLVDA